MARISKQRISLLAPPVLRRFLSVVAVAAVILLLIVFALFLQDAAHQRTILQNESGHVIDLQREILSLEFNSVRSDLLYLSRLAALTRFLSGDADSRKEVEDEFARFAASKGVYDQIRCLDTTGHEIVCIDCHEDNADVVPSDQMQNKATRYYFEPALEIEAGEVFVSPFDLKVEHGSIQHPFKPVIRFLTPVFDRSGEKRGLLVLNYLGDRLLAKLKDVSEGFRGETMLVNLAGEYVQAPNPKHEWGRMRLHEHDFPNHFPQAWQQVEKLTAAQFYIGSDLFTSQRVSPDQKSLSPEPVDNMEEQDDPTSLVLVSHIPQSIATAHSSRLLRQLLLMCGGALVLVAVLARYWARSGAIRQIQERKLMESERRLRRLSTRLLGAHEAERRKLSRDLHDELGQQVTAITLGLRSMAQEDLGPRANPLLRRAVADINHLLESLHEISSEVRPTALDDLGLQDAVLSFIDKYQSRTEIAVATDLRLENWRIPRTIRENVYRVLQEALSNVAAHAATSEVSVTIEVTDTTLVLRVEDIGRGFDVETLQETQRLGVLGMRERIELLDGEFEIESAPDEGTRIRVAVPLSREDAQPRIHRE